jgi:hypothetical protein
MILPGLLPLAFYRREPTKLEVGLSLAATVVLSALLGYVSPPGPLTRLGSVVVAIAGGLLLYAGLFFVVRARLRARSTPPPQTRP